MTLEEKVGQMTQLEIGMVCDGRDQNLKINPAKLEKAVVKYGVSSILNVSGEALPIDKWHEIIGQIPESPPHASQGKAKHRHDPEMHHAFTEAFRSLGISLVYSLNLAETTKPKTILVTSAVPAEGKSTVASNLAASLVQSGSKVLLVDADLRRSSLHKTFGVSLKPGLREVLGKVLPISEAIVPVEVQRLHPDISSKLSPDVSCNLFLLPAGECNIGPSESFLGSEMDSMLKDLKSHYDYIIIDTPPLLAASDTMSLVPKADFVLMVLRASYTSLRVVRDALNRLYRCNARSLGIVYNRAAASTDYFYRYSHDYTDKLEIRDGPLLVQDVALPAKQSLAVQRPVTKD